MASQLELMTEKHGPSVVLRPKGRLDNVTALLFQQRFDQILAMGETRFIVDLAGLEYISSAGMRSLLALAMQLRSRENGAIAFARPSGMVQDVLRVSGFNQMFTVYPTVEEALKA